MMFLFVKIEIPMGQLVLYSYFTNLFYILYLSLHGFFIFTYKIVSIYKRPFKTYMFINISLMKPILILYHYFTHGTYFFLKKSSIDQTP